MIPTFIKDFAAALALAAFIFVTVNYLDAMGAALRAMH